MTPCVMETTPCDHPNVSRQLNSTFYFKDSYPLLLLKDYQVDSGISSWFLHCG